MSEPIERSDFAAAMQQLSSQAGRREERPSADATTAALTDLLNAVHALGQRLEGVEGTVARNFEALEISHSASLENFALQFQKLDEQLAAIRNSETVNQQLFDSLHRELISYRDNFVREALQKPFIRDLLVLFDDLSALGAQLDRTVAGAKGVSSNEQLAQNLNNALHFLLEILHRLEVDEIETKERVDFNLHRVISFVPAEKAEDDGRIVE